MKKVININFQGQVIAIEETAYEILKKYIESLKKYFAKEEDGTEIVNDIENRIAELFGNRLKLGINCITDEDVESIVASIGRPEDFDTDYEEADPPKTENEETKKSDFSSKEQSQQQSQAAEEKTEERHLYRNSNDKILGGVCSGLAHYLKIDPIFVRLAFVLLFSILFWVYLLMWIILKPMPLKSNITKRLYRNPNDKIIGGVCGGIATYFNIDAWIPRLIFVLPFFLNVVVGVVGIPFFLFPWNNLFDKVNFNFNFNFGVIIVYIVLWIIIPRATSIKQKLEMMGEEEYIKSIRNTVSDNVANVKSKMENEPTSEYSASSTTATDKNVTASLSSPVNMPPEPPKNEYQKSYAYATTTDAKPQRSGCLSAISVLLKIILFGMVSIFAIVVTVSFFAMFFTSVSFMQLQALFLDKGYESSLFWITIIGTLGIPAIASIVWLVRKIVNAKSRPIIGYITSLLWVAGIVSGIILTTRIINKFKVESSSDRHIELTQPTAGKLYIDMQIYPFDYYSIKTSIGDGGDISSLPYYTENEDTLLFDNISLKIVESSDSLFHVRTEAICSGKNPKEAKRYTNDFSYTISQRDSILILPEFFQTPFSQGFRNQGIIVEVSVPVGKRIEISDKLNSYKYNNLNRDERNGKKKRNNIRSKGRIKWNSEEEYTMQNGELIGTTLQTDSI